MKKNARRCELPNTIHFGRIALANCLYRERLI